MLVYKEIIRPGTYWYIDPKTQLPRRLHATPALVKHFHDSGKDMLSSGLSIPIPLEHQPTARPLTAAELAAQQLRDNSGFVKDYLFKKVKQPDGSEVDALFGALDIQDPKIASKLPKTIRWTSPWINSFVDGNGKAWNGVISHIALTTRPRITQQQPFADIGAAMSFAGQIPNEELKTENKELHGFEVSRAGILGLDGAALKPMYPLAFSLYTGIALDVAGMAKNDKASDNDPPGNQETPPSPGGEPSVEKSLVDGDGDISVYDVICDLLAAQGYDLPEGTDSGNFAERMYKACMGKMKDKGAQMGAPTNQPPGGNKNDLPANPPVTPPIVQEQPPLYMSLSLEDAQKIQDPNQRQIALSLVHSRKRTEALENNAMESAKRVRQARIDRLAQKLPKSALDLLIAQATSAKFALGDDGIVKDDLDTTLKILEGGIPDLPDILMTRSSHAALSEVGHPQEYQGIKIDEQRAQSLADNMTRGLPKQPVAKAS